MELIVEPVKQMIEKACQAASSLLTMHAGKDVIIEFQEYILGDVVSIYLKMDDKIMYSKVWNYTDENTELDVRIVLYGELLTELVATYCIVVNKVKGD